MQISGSFSEGEAKNLARVLRSGALPVQLQTQTVQNVSPTLGKDSLKAAIVAGSIGVLPRPAVHARSTTASLGIVVIGGVVVSGALIWSVVVAAVADVRAWPCRWPGITGIIVSVGVTVDSYVVFFERLKDEVRAGRSMRNGAQRAFSGAWHTILVADLVSLMGALVLWYLTVGSVRNFAFFLGLSTLCDLAVAYFFTRPSVLLLSRTHWMARRKVMGIEASVEHADERGATDVSGTRRAPTVAIGPTGRRRSPGSAPTACRRDAARWVACTTARRRSTSTAGGGGASASRRC